MVTIVPGGATAFDLGVSPTHAPQRGVRREGIPRKEVIQPHLPVRLPCYDFTPVTRLTLGVGVGTTSGPPRSHGVTGGVYKAREHIHRGVLTRGY